MARKYTPKAQKKTPFGKLFGVRKKRPLIEGDRYQDRAAKVGKRRAKSGFVPKKRQHYKIRS